MIRLAESHDIPAINKLGELLHHNFSKVFNVQNMLDDNISKVFVYEDNGCVVAFLLATCLYETVDILSIVVEPNYRRKKIASNLFDYLISGLSETVETITLEVAVNNEAAIELYKKFGFEIINIRKKYYNDVDAYLMGRRLK